MTNDTTPQGLTGTPTEDPDILPDKVTTPEGDTTKLAHDFTLSEEGEGDNIIGNKELRDLKDNEDESSSKRVNVPSPTPATE